MSYLISEQYLKEVTSVTTNKTAKEIAAAFKSVTMLDIKPLLVGLYDVLVAGEELTTEQDVLLDYVKYFMALRVEREMMFNILTIGNKGATEAENVANLEVVKLKRTDTDNKSEAIRKMILEYLHAHKEAFPEYFPANTIQVPLEDTFSVGIVFDETPKFYYQ